MNDDALRTDLVRLAKSLFERGYTVGSSGNISARTQGGFLVTPTNACLGFLTPDQLSYVSPTGAHLAGDAPTKEMPMHLAAYAARPNAQAVVHLHSTYATLLSCLQETDPQNALAPITPYAVMRLGKVPVLPYTKPGAAAIVPLLTQAMSAHSAVLLANHGPVVAGLSLASAVYAAEELEETAKLLILAHNLPANHLTSAQIEDLEASFKLRG
jgi:3-dehydro-4-phosphotetronate decarboxylase